MGQRELGKEYFSVFTGVKAKCTKNGTPKGKIVYKRGKKDTTFFFVKYINHKKEV